MRQQAGAKVCAYGANACDTLHIPANAGQHRLPQWTQEADNIVLSYLLQVT